MENEKEIEFFLEIIYKMYLKELKEGKISKKIKAIKVNDSPNLFSYGT